LINCFKMSSFDPEELKNKEDAQVISRCE